MINDILMLGIVIRGEFTVLTKMDLYGCVSGLARTTPMCTVLYSWLQSVNIGFLLKLPSLPRYHRYNIYPSLQ